MLDLFPALTRFWFREERDLSLESLARARQLVWASFRLSSSSKYYQWKGVQHPSWNTGQGDRTVCKYLNFTFRCEINVNFYSRHFPFGNSLQAGSSLLSLRANRLGPERWWTILDQIQVRGNPDGGSLRCWRANRSSELSIAAKDPSNHLVAGSFRNFSQDSWHLNIAPCGKDND